MMLESLGGLAADGRRPGLIHEASQEGRDDVGVGMQRGQLDQQHLDLLGARLAEQALHAVEALRLGRIAEPEHRRPAKVEAELHAAIAGAIDRVGARASIVQQHGEVPALERHRRRVDQLDQGRALA